MRAIRLLHWKSEPDLVEVPEPRPGPGQVVVRVGGAGTSVTVGRPVAVYGPWGCGT